MMSMGASQLQSNAAFGRGRGVGRGGFGIAGAPGGGGFASPMQQPQMGMPPMMRSSSSMSSVPLKGSPMFGQPSSPFPQRSGDGPGALARNMHMGRPGSALGSGPGIYGPPVSSPMQSQFAHPSMKPPASPIHQNNFNYAMGSGSSGRYFNATGYNPHPARADMSGMGRPLTGQYQTYYNKPMSSGMPGRPGSGLMNPFGDSPMTRSSFSGPATRRPPSPVVGGGPMGGVMPGRGASLGGRNKHVGWKTPEATRKFF